MGPTPPELIVVGHVNKVHGTKGELFIWPLTDHPEETFTPGRTLQLGAGETGTEPVDLPPPEIADVRSYRKGYLVRFSGVHDRTQAEPYRGFYLLRPFAEVAEKDEGEFFYHELLGLVVETVDGVRVGEVTEVFPVEPEQMLQVTGGERSLLVPFSRRIVREIDLDRGRILIDPPEGLLDL